MTITVQYINYMDTKKWYHKTWGIIALLILFFPAGLYLMWRHTNWNKRVKWGITGFFALMFLIGAVTPDSTTTPTPNTNSQTTQAQPTDTPTPKNETKKLSYEVVKKDVNSTVENYKVLIPAGEDGKAVAMEVKKSCSKPCNIAVYDDRKAVNLEIEYEKMMGDINTPIEAPQEWKKKNYVYVADHHVGYIDFETGNYKEYPYKDWYYKELKGE
jgi:hypothetical protein